MQQLLHTLAVGQKRLSCKLQLPFHTCKKSTTSVPFDLSSTLVNDDMSINDTPAHREIGILEINEFLPIVHVSYIHVSLKRAHSRSPTPVSHAAIITLTAIAVFLLDHVEPMRHSEGWFRRRRHHVVSFLHLRSIEEQSPFKSPHLSETSAYVTTSAAIPTSLRQLQRQYRQ